MQLTGRAYIKLNGILQRSQNGAKLMFGNDEKTTVIGDNGVQGYTSKPGEPKVEATFSHGADTSLTELANFSGSVTFETDTGKTYILRDSWLANSLELTANENAELPCVFAGISCEEVD